MSYTVTIPNQCGIDGSIFGPTHTITAAVKAAINTSVAVAKPGDLTTRTNDTVGTLTMDSGHGFTTGQRLDLYWVVADVRYRRYGVAIGTVSTNSVPISGGAGDNLPTNNTAITGIVPTLMALAVDAESLQLLAGSSVSSGDATVDAMATFVQADGDAVFNMRMTGDGYLWHADDGTDNPLDVMAGTDDVPTQVYLSHADEAGAAAMKIVGLYN